MGVQDECTGERRAKQRIDYAAMERPKPPRSDSFSKLPLATQARYQVVFGNRGWPQSVRGMVQELRLTAKHKREAADYAETEADRLEVEEAALDAEYGPRT